MRDAAENGPLPDGSSATGSTSLHTSTTGTLTDTTTSENLDCVIAFYADGDPDPLNLTIASPDGENQSVVAEFDPDASTGAPYITPDRHLVFSPNGLRIAFAVDSFDAATGLAVVGVEGTGLVTINLPTDYNQTHQLAASWSPDGSLLARSTTYDIDGVPDIWVTDATTGATTLVSASGKDPHLSPDGSRILLENGGVLFTMDTDGANILQAHVGWDGVWGPNGASLLYFSPAHSGLASSDVDGSNETAVTDSFVEGRPPVSPLCLDSN